MNRGRIDGGEFYGTVKVGKTCGIGGGYFYGEVINDGFISDGRFEGTVINMGGLKKQFVFYAEDTVYDGTIYTGASVDYRDDWTGDRNMEITYMTAEGTALDAAPVEVGEYIAMITYDRRRTL